MPACHLILTPVRGKVQAKGHKALLICKNYFHKTWGKPICENCAPRNFGDIRYTFVQLLLWYLSLTLTVDITNANICAAVHVCVYDMSLLGSHSNIMVIQQVNDQ